MILRKKIYKFIKDELLTTLEQSIKNSNSLLDLRAKFIDCLTYFIEHETNKTIKFVNKNKNLLKYLDVYINQNHPNGIILIINNTKELVINDSDNCFIINSQNVKIINTNELTILHSQNINVNNATCRLIKYSHNVDLINSIISYIMNSNSIKALDCILNFISATDLTTKFCTSIKCHHGTKIDANYCNDVILFDTSCAYTSGNTNITCCENSYCIVTDKVTAIFENNSNGSIRGGSSIVFNNYSHGIVKNNKNLPNIILNNNSILYSSEINIDLDKIEINNNSIFKHRNKIYTKTINEI